MTRDRDVPTHLWRLAIAGAGFPTWPAALEILAEYGGQRIAVGAEVADFDVARAMSGATVELGPDLCPIGRIGDRWIGANFDGNVFVDGQQFDDVASWLAFTAR